LAVFVLNLLQSSFPTLEELLAPELMAEIRQQGRRVRYGNGELIQLRGEAPTGFAIVQMGQVIAGTEGADGSFLTAALLSPGDHFGEPALFAGLPRLQNLRAIGETEILHIPARRFLQVFEREPDVGRALLTIALRRIHFMMEFMDGQRRWPLPVRIAHLLLTSVENRELARRHTIHCRQEDLAGILGVSRVAVSKALKSLQADGLVTMGYGSIELADVQAMLEWLDDTYQVVPIQPDADWRF
jgi:CRP/FNR family transcriptional regulator